MSDFNTFRGVKRLPNDLWDEKTLVRDAKGFAVVSVDRYRGPRRSDCLGAHPYWELVAVLGGSGEILGSGLQALPRPSVVLIPPGCMHGEQGDHHFDTVWIGLEGSRLRGKRSGVRLARDEELCRLAEDLWIQASVRTDRCGAELDGLALALVGRFLRKLGSNQGGDLIDHAVRWLHDHLDRQIHIADLARELRISSAHLHRLFKARTGSSPKAFLETLRIDRAAHLLRHTDLPVVRVSELVGFSDPLYFSRVFARATGIRPSRFASR